MKEKLHEIPIDLPLTAARRKAVGQYIESNAHLSPRPVAYEWEETILTIKVDPLVAEMRFSPKVVDLYGTAPLWVRLLLTEKKKILLKEQVELMLKETGFVAEKKKAKIK